MIFLKAKQQKALFEVVAMGQNNGVTPPTRAQRKAAKWAYKVFLESKPAPERHAS